MAGSLRLLIIARSAPMIAALLASRRAGRDGVISDRCAPDSPIQRDLSDFGNMLSIIDPDPAPNTAG